MKLLRLKKQVLSPVSVTNDKDYESPSKPDNLPSRNAQNELLAKFKKITGTQDTKSEFNS